MKRGNINSLITVFLSLLVAFLFSNPIMAQSFGPPCEAGNGFCKSLSIGLIPPSFSANSEAFSVNNVGTLFIQFSVDTYLNNVGNSKYKISIRKGAPGSNPAIQVGEEVATKEVTEGGGLISIDIKSCDKTGRYHVRITNTSTDNPQIGRADLSYLAPSLITRDLDMEGYTLDLNPGNESLRTITKFTKKGRISLKGKWHVPAIIPTYAKLKISLLRPDDSVALASKEYFSYHYVEGSPKFNVNYLVTENDINIQNNNSSKSWKLKIVNNSEHKIEGFNIKKEGDPNPFVPEFKSIFTNACGQ